MPARTAFTEKDLIPIIIGDALHTAAAFVGGEDEVIAQSIHQLDDKQAALGLCTQLILQYTQDPRVLKAARLVRFPNDQLGWQLNTALKAYRDLDPAMRALQRQAYLKAAGHIAPQPASEAHVDHYRNER
jgi:hypothetical protein